MQSSRRYGSKVVDNDNKLFIKLATGKIDNNVDKKDMYFSVANVKKNFMLVNYDPRVVPDLKIPHIMTPESLFMSIKYS